MKCWASSYGTCSSKISREHIVSANIFTSTKVKVDGLPWCKDKTKIVGLPSLVKKHLCAKHNSELSELDAEAGRFYKVVQAFTTPIPLTRAEKEISNFYINGPLLERWLLKTSVNILFEEQYFFDLSIERGHPHQELVNIAFGTRRWPSGRGLYSARRVPHKFKPSESIEFTPIAHGKDKYLVGCFFILSGFSFYLSLREDPFTDRHRMCFWGFGNDLDHYSLHYRQPVWHMEAEGFLSRHIHFSWNEV